MVSLLDLLSMNEKNRALETAGFRGGNTTDMNRALFQAVDRPLLQAVQNQNTKNRMINAFNRPTGNLSALTSPTSSFSSLGQSMNAQGTFPKVSKAQNVIDNTEENYLKASGLINQVGRNVPSQQTQQKTSGVGSGLLKFAQSPQS